MDKPLMGVNNQIEKVANHIDAMESQRELTNSKFDKKDAKRTRELARVQEKINETVIADPQ